MRRALSVAGCALLALSALALPAESAVKAGAKCSKVGATTSKSAVSYKCSRVGKTLVWKKMSSANSSSPAAPIPAASPSLSPTPLPSPRPTKPAKFSELEPTNVMRVVMNDFASFPKAIGAKPNVEIIKAPNVSNAVFTYFADKLRDGERFFTDRFVSTKKHVFIIGNELDIDFVSEEAAKRGDKELGVRLKADLAARGKFFTSGSFGPEIGQILFHSTYDLETLKYPYSDLSVHEYAHIYQYEKNRNEIGSVWSNFGCLWTEGHAEFIAQYEAWPKESDLEGFRNYYFNRDITRDYQLKLDNKEKVVQYLKDSEDVANSRCKGMYSIGTIVIEGLVAIHSLEKLHNFYVEISKGMNSRQAFLKTFSMSIDDFYQEIADYVLSVQKKYGVIKG